MLILGPRQNIYDQKKTGGVTILFELFLEELRQRNISFDVIDTLVDNNGGKVQALMGTYVRILKKFRHVEHISLQASQNVLLYVAPLAVILGKLFGKQISVRVFAGGMNNKYEQSFLFKMVSGFVLRNVDAVFFETKYLVEYFRPYNPHTYWLPNVRKREMREKKSNNFQRRFVYIGTINEEKGIDLLCDIAKKLPEDVTLDLYGPIIEEKYSNDYFHARGVNYKGALRPDEVLDVMSTYDVLVLPSYREGYPGVIIEAFMLGLPVIATKLDGIMEMVEDGYNGLLIDIGSEEQLYEAILSIDAERYRSMHEHARASFEPYDSHARTAFFLEKIGYDVS